MSVIARIAQQGHAAGLWHRVARIGRHRLTILTYHGVTEKPDRLGPLAGLHVSAADFDAQLSYLAAHHRVLPLQEALEQLDGGAALPRGAVCITFDDGYLNNYEVARPILARHDLPATIFLTAGFIGTEIVLWPDRLAHALVTAAPHTEIKLGDETWTLGTPTDVADAWGALARRLKVLPEAQMQAALAGIDAQCGVSPADDHAFGDSRLMSWEHAREMQAGGLITFGSHTMTHPILSRIDAERLEEELSDARRIIEGELDAPCPILAYPNGGPEDVTDEVIACAMRAGYTHALTTTLGRARRGMDPFRLPRVSAGVATPDAAHFAFQVSGARAWLMAQKRHLRR